MIATPICFARIVLGAPGWIYPVVGLVVLLFGTLLWSYFRAPTRSSIKVIAASLKTIGIIALAVCVLEPLFSGTRPRPGANAVALIVDNSQSINVHKNPSAFANVLQDDAPWHVRLCQDFDVRTYRFDRQIERIESFRDLTWDGTASALTSALETVTNRLRDRPSIGVFVFTDGIATDWDTQRLARILDARVPIYPVLPARLESVRDLSIDSMNVTETNFEAAPTTIEATLSARGMAGETIVGQLIDEDGKIAAEQSKSINDRTQVTFRFQFRPEKAGLSFYRFQAFASRDRGPFTKHESGSELTFQNNKRWAVVDRGGGPYRILYVSGRPNWEFKFLRRALDEDAEIKLSGLLRIARKEPKFAFRDRSGLGDANRLFEGFENKDDQDVESYDQPVLLRLGIDSEEELRDGFPNAAADLFKYHAIIIDDLESAFFTADQMSLIRRFVAERGGGLMMIGGQESFKQGQYARTPIADLLPVYVDIADEDVPRSDREEGFRWSLTREGMLQPWVRVRSTETGQTEAQTAIPRFQTVHRLPEPKPGTQVLSELAVDESDQRLPGLIVHSFGKGRAAALSVGDMWRWAMHREQENSASDLAQFWRQVTRWLVSDLPRRVELRVSRFTANRPSRVEVVVRDEDFQLMDNANVSVAVTMPEQQELTIDATPTDQRGLYEAEFWAKLDGPHRFTATVTSEDGSLVGTRTIGWSADPSAAEFAAVIPNRQRMRQLAEQTGGEIVEANDLHRFVKKLPNRKIPITEPWVFPLWHHPLVLSFAIACLCGEWWLRRWKGLP